MILREKWKAAEQALSNAKQEAALKIITDILAVIDPKYGEVESVKTTREMQILCRAQCQRIQTLFESGLIELSSFPQESAKLDNLIYTILSDLKPILRTIEENRIEITTVNNKVIDVKTTEDYALSEEDFLEMMKIIAKKLEIDFENIFFKYLK